ncbi:MAG: sterol desaturase family protein [Zetaproteobacteria bacterium]|nr:MAG: sterol desaturase family protein [Zetaproteobacteria bacterium]
MVRRVRWPGNFALLALDVLLLRLLFPLGAAGFAALWPWGLLHMVPLPGWLAGLLAVVLLDLVIYWQHRLFHRLPLLWRLHRVHHTDPRLDVSSALRFHPLEILLSMAIKVAAIALIGAGATAVLCFEVLLNGMAMFNHGNIALPGRIERSLRRWLVTPDMHRIHHSVVAGEYNSNFGFNLSCWDRLFGSYRAAPRGGQRGMTIGLQQWRDPAACGRLGWMLRAPWMAAS